MLFSLVRFYFLKRHITVETEAAQANCIYRPWGLREMDGVPSKEICTTLSITDSNLWVMLYRTRMALQECLEMNWFDTAAGGTV